MWELLNQTGSVGCYRVLASIGGVAQPISEGLGERSGPQKKRHLPKVPVARPICIDNVHPVELEI